MDFSKQLIEARKAAGMTQEQLGEALHVTRATISHWEVGRHAPDLEMIQKIAEVLHCSFDLGGDRITVGEAEQEVEEIPADGRTEPLSSQEKKKNDGFPAKSRILIAVALLAVACVIFFVLILPSLNSKTGDTSSAASSMQNEDDSETKATVSGTSGAENQEDPESVGDEMPLYQIEDFKAVTPREEGKAYLAIDTSTEVIKGDNMDFWMYYFTMREENGYAFTMDRGETIWFLTDSTQPMIMNHNDLFAAQVNADLPARGITEMSGGFPMKQQNMIGVGFRVYGHDENGAEMIFSAYIPFPEE